MDEPGRPAIERNGAFMTDVRQVNMTGRAVSHGASAWCAPPTHCATGVDDQLADAVVEQCFSKLFAFRPSCDQCGSIPAAVHTPRTPGRCNRVPEAAIAAVEMRGFTVRRCA